MTFPTSCAQNINAFYAARRSRMSSRKERKRAQNQEELAALTPGTARTPQERDGQANGKKRLTIAGKALRLQLL